MTNIATMLDDFVNVKLVDLKIYICTALCEKKRQDEVDMMDIEVDHGHNSSRRHCSVQ